MICDKCGGRVRKSIILEKFRHFKVEMNYLIEKLSEVQYQRDGLQAELHKMAETVERVRVEADAELEQKDNRIEDLLIQLEVERDRFDDLFAQVTRERDTASVGGPSTGRDSRGARRVSLDEAEG